MKEQVGTGEQLICNQQVVGSNPSAGSRCKNPRERDLQKSDIG
jgi:hypothetical protein